MGDLFFWYLIVCNCNGNCDEEQRREVCLQKLSFWVCFACVRVLRLQNNFYNLCTLFTFCLICNLSPASYTSYTKLPYIILTLNSSSTWPWSGGCVGRKLGRIDWRLMTSSGNHHLTWLFLRPITNQPVLCHFQNALLSVPYSGLGCELKVPKPWDAWQNGSDVINALRRSLCRATSRCIKHAAWTQHRCWLLNSLDLAKLDAKNERHAQLARVPALTAMCIPKMLRSDQRPFVSSSALKLVP